MSEPVVTDPIYAPLDEAIPPDEGDGGQELNPDAG